MTDYFTKELPHKSPSEVAGDVQDKVSHRCHLSCCVMICLEGNGGNSEKTIERINGSSSHVSSDNIDHTMMVMIMIK